MICYDINKAQLHKYPIWDKNVKQLIFYGILILFYSPHVFLADTHSKHNKFETLYLAYVRVKGKIEKEISKSIIIF